MIDQKTLEKEVARVERDEITDKLLSFIHDKGIDLPTKMGAGLVEWRYRIGDEFYYFLNMRLSRFDSRPCLIIEVPVGKPEDLIKGVIEKAGFVYHSDRKYDFPVNGGGWFTEGQPNNTTHIYYRYLALERAGDMPSVLSKMV